MVRASLGIGIVPTAVADPVPQNTVLRQIEGLKLELPVGIALSSEKSISSLALDRLFEIIKDEFASQNKPSNKL